MNIVNKNITIASKKVLVTGANRGIGKALVETLLERGAAQIYATARQLESLQPLVALAPGIITPVQLDVTKPEQIVALKMQLSGLDILINNAGIATGSGFNGEQTLAIAREEMDTNYFGLLNLTHALLPLLQQSKSGAVVNISSIAGISNFPLLGPYSASKAAVHSLTQGLRAELGKENIFVQGVYPGPVDTRLAEGMEMAKATPTAVANAILTGLEEGVEDIYPDEFSIAMMAIFNQSPKALEQQFATVLG